MFSCMKISYPCFQHLGAQILDLMSTKNQPMENKNHYPYSPFRMGFLFFKKIISYII